MEHVTREEWMHALLGVQRGRLCWCEMACGNPMVKEHSKACENARELFFSTARPITTFVGSGKGGDKRDVAPGNAVPGVESTP